MHSMKTTTIDKPFSKRVMLRFYSANNLGDDLFVKIITERYANDFSVISHQEVPSFQSITSLTVYKNRIRSSLSNRIGGLLKKSDLWLSFLTKKHDLLVYIGGSIFIEGNDIESWKQQRDFYSRIKIPYYILGSNYGPQKTAEFKSIVKDILSNAEDVCFRDNTSYKLFKDLNTTRVATDIAFSLNTSKYEVKNEKIAIISLVNCANRFDKKTANKYDQEVINMTHQLIRNDYRVIFMSFCKYEGDEIASERLMNNLDSTLIKNVSVYNYRGDLEEALALIAKCEIVIASRFHAAILGLLFSKRVLPMAYSQKTIDMLNDLHFKGDIVDINAIDSFDGNIFDFKNLKVNKVDKQIQLAEVAFQKLDMVLDRR